MDTLLKSAPGKKPESIFKNTDFMLLFSGKLISMLGDQIYVFALSWYVLSITHSSVKMSLLMMLGLLPYVVVGPFAGVIADKVERKKVIVALDLVRGVIVILMAALLSQNILNMPFLYLGAVVLGVCGSVFNPAASAIIPNIVKKEDLIQAASVDNFVSSLCNIAGMLTGGILYGLIGITSVFIINAVSYFISAVLESNVKIPRRRITADCHTCRQNENIKSALRELGAGYGFLKSNKGLLALFVLFAAVNFILYPVGVIFIPYIFNVILKSTAIQLSIAQGTVWLGFIAGSFIVPRLPPKQKLQNTMAGSISVAGAVILLLAFPVIPACRGYFSTWSTAVLYAVFSAVLGFGMTFLNIPVNVTFQKIIPDNIRGRVMALISSATSASVPIGYILGGFLVQTVPVHAILIVMSAIMVTIVFCIKKVIQVKK